MEKKKLNPQESLRKMREVDDKIIYALNTSIPTESFRGQVSAGNTCQTLFDQLSVAHQQRADAIKNCIMMTADGVKELRTQRESNRNDVSVDKSFKSEQRKVRQVTFPHLLRKKKKK